MTRLESISCDVMNVITVYCDVINNAKIYIINYLLRNECFGDTQNDMRAPSRILTSARILLGKTQREVASDCGLAAKTVYLAEKGDAGLVAVERLMAHYERSGIRFIRPSEGEGWGISASFLILPYEHNQG